MAKTNNNEFRVIGAGFGRTGTSSLKAALGKLGINSYHMDETFTHPEHEKKIIEISKKKYDLKKKHNINSYDQWDKIMLNEEDIDDLCNAVFYDKDDKNKLVYQATVDWPFCSFYQELMRKYPDAKIILSVRDSAEKWYESTMGSIYPISFVTCNRWLMRYTSFYTHHILGKYTMWGLCFDCDEENKFANDKQYGCDKYNQWIDSVKKYANDNNRDLLIFNVKQGWKPLCDFLKIDDVPNEPFPYVNERKKIADTNKMVNRVCNIVNGSLTVGMVGTIGYFGYKQFFGTNR